MGMYSWTCAVCSYDVLSDEVQGYKDYNRARLLFPNGDRMSGPYNGYGMLAGVDLGEQRGGFKVVHEACWKDTMTYDTLGETHHARNQGFWVGERKAEELWGPPNMEEIKHESDYVCYECCRVFKSKWTVRCPFGCAGPKPCDEHAVNSVITYEAAFAANWRKEDELREAVKERLMAEGASKNEAHNMSYSAPYDAGCRINMCLKCDAAGHATVVPMEYDRDSVAICHNEKDQTREDQSPHRCYAYGAPQQLKRIPDTYEDYTEDLEPPRCHLCRSGEYLTFLTLIKTPLQSLAKEAL